MDLIRVPQINANEEEVEVVEVLSAEGEWVEGGDVLCVLESTKATMDLAAPADGYVRRLAIEPGDRVRVGSLICALTAEKDASLVGLEKRSGPVRSGGDEQVRATRRAQGLIEEYDVEIQAIENGGIVTERDVLSYLEREGRDLRAPRDRLGDVDLGVAASHGDGVVIYGAGGHARVVIELIRQGRRDLEPVAVVDDSDEVPADVLGVPVVGDAHALGTLRKQGVEYAALGIGAVTHNALRAELFARLQRLGFGLPNLIHPDATVESSVRMGRGNQVFAGAVISSNAELGDNAIINSQVVVSHDCRIGDHVHLTPGAMLAGAVSVGARTVIGMGVTVYLGVTIEADVVVPNGQAIFEDIVDSGVQRTQRGDR